MNWYIRNILKIFLVTSLSFIAASPVQAYPYVKTAGRQLLTDFDADGQYTPFTIQAVGYSPFPIGRHPSDWGWPAGDDRDDNIYNDPQILDRDFTLLKSLNVNAVRIWKGNDTQDGERFPVKLTQKTFDSADRHNIKIIAGFKLDQPGWIECNGTQRTYVTLIDYSNESVRNDLLTRFETYVREFKDHPALLFWVIGNEENIYLNPDDPQAIASFYSLVNEMAARAHEVEGANAHPVAYVNGELTYIGQEQYGTTDADMPDIDIWGINLYNGPSFGELFSDYTALSGKPLWLSEFGIDSWFSQSHASPEIGYEDQTSQAQYFESLWDEIISNRDVCIGGSVMEYSDEWWKPSEWLCGDDSDLCNRTQNHFGFGPTDISCPTDGVPDWIPASPDEFFNEEWWGIMSIAPGGEVGDPDVMIPKEISFSIQDRYADEPSPPVINYIAPQTVFPNQELNLELSVYEPNREDITWSASQADGEDFSSINAVFTPGLNKKAYFSMIPENPPGVSYEALFRATNTSGLTDALALRIDVVAPQMTFPAPGETIGSTSVNFQWSPKEGASEYWLIIETHPGWRDLFSQSLGLGTSAVVNNIPLHGGRLYARLWSKISGVWSYEAYDYDLTEPLPAEILEPSPGSELMTETVTFQWDPVEGAVQYWLQVGTGMDRYGRNKRDIANFSTGTATSATVSNIPAGPLSVRLWTKFNGVWAYTDQSYTSIPSAPELTEPDPGSMLDSGTVTFHWTDGGPRIEQYWVWVGTTMGGRDVYTQNQDLNTSVEISGIPLDRPVYVRLWFKSSGIWFYNDYEYQTVNM